jgi:omptin
MRIFCAVAALCLSTGVIVAQAETKLASGLIDEPQPLSWDSEILSLGLSAGWLTGRSHEYVYYQGEKISELIWDLNHAYVVSADLSMRLIPALKLNMRGSFGGHIDSYMEDYDWLALGYGVTDWTDRSQHDDTELDHFLRFDLNLQYDFLRTDVLTLGGLLGARFTDVQWSAYGGDYVYTSTPGTTFRDQNGSFDDDWLGITYEQSYTTPYVGVAGSLTLDRLRFSGALAANPISYLSTQDDHWLRDLTVTADFARTEYLGATAELSYL